MKATPRTVESVEVIKLDGKITIGSGDQQLREIITNALNQGKTKILLDMGERGARGGLLTLLLAAAFAHSEFAALNPDSRGEALGVVRSVRAD